MRTTRALAMCSLAVLAACARGRPTSVGELAVEWTSDDSVVGRGTWRGRAEAGWCEAQHRLTVFAARGDTGAALLVVLPAIAPGDSIPLVAATDTASPRRATVALRWPADRSMNAFESGTGALQLVRVTPTLAGRFEGTLARRGNGDSVVPAPRVHGRFDDLTVVTGEAGCRLAGVGPTP